MDILLLDDVWYLGILKMVGTVRYSEALTSCVGEEPNTMVSCRFKDFLLLLVTLTVIYNNVFRSRCLRTGSLEC